MAELDFFTWILTGALVFVTVLVWRATSHVAKATEKVAEVSRETTKIPIMPRISIINHNKLGEDEEYDHYEFILRNDGVGDSFDLKIEHDRKAGSIAFPIIRNLATKDRKSVV